MTNNQRNDRDEARHLMVSGMALIVASFLLGIFLVVAGCSGGHKKMPTDPAGSKPADQNPITDQGVIGDVDQGDISDQDTIREGSSDWDWAMPYIDDLLNQGGGQGGVLLAFQPTIYCAVFDSSTHMPIESAYVSAGSDGSVVDDTDVEGLVTLDATALITPGEPIYLTAGANGYVMQSVSYLLSNVFVYFLDPLVPAAPASATVTGTVDFYTDDFYAEVHSTNMISATDGVLEPSAPTDEDDTFEIKVTPNTLGHLYCTLRDTITNDILSFRTVGLVQRLVEDETFVLDFEYFVNPDGEQIVFPDPPMDEDFILDSTSILYDYSANSNGYQSSYSLPYHSTSPIDTISYSTSYFDSIYSSYIPMSDTVIWSRSGGERMKETTILRFDIVTEDEPWGNPINIDELIGNQRNLPMTSAVVILDVIYEDASGSSFVWSPRPGDMENQIYIVPTPPAINSPTDGALGVTLNPTIDCSWHTEGDFLQGGQFQLRLVDSVNANEWVIKINPENDVLATTLPTLPAEQESWGLTIGNEVLAIIEESTPFTTGGFIPGISSPVELEQSNYSGVNHFTP